MNRDYSKMTLPELYVEASKRGIRDFIKKNEEEMALLLATLDEKESKVKPIKNSKVNAPIPNKTGFKKAMDAFDETNIDDIIDLDSIDETPVVTSSKVAKKLGLKEATRSFREDEPDSVESISVEDDTDEMLAEINQEPIPAQSQTQSSKKGENQMAKTTSAPKAEKAAPVKVEKAAPAKAAKEAPARGNIGEKAPYVENTAGFCCFLALKKGGTMEQVVAVADQLIAKTGAKPPADTKAKIKIIMTEVNAGKKGDTWGKFEMNEKGKIVWSE
jgi:hypothetical protein